MEIDVIILSNTSTFKHYGLLQRTINTLDLSEPNFKFNIIVVETNNNYLQQGFYSPGVKVITPNEPKFNYNRFLNLGLKECKNEWIIIANNDVAFTQNWLTKIFEVQKLNPSIKSFSPLAPNWPKHKEFDTNRDYYLGYRTSYEIAGWCLVMHKSVITECNLFDEQFEYWYQDNDYAMNLQVYKIPHALVPKSRVYHVISASWNLMDKQRKEVATKGMLEVFNKKWSNFVKK